MAGKNKQDQDTSEVYEVLDGDETLDFDDLLDAGYAATTRNGGGRQGDLADYIGEVVTIVGLYTGTRKGARTVVELQADDGIPTRVKAPQAVIDGLSDAYRRRPGARFMVKVINKGNTNGRKRYAGLAAAN